MQSLAARFASLPREQQEDLIRAELRLVNFHLVYDGTVKTRDAIVADIKKNVLFRRRLARSPSGGERWEYGSNYYQLYRAEALTAGFNAARVNSDIMYLGTASESMSQNTKTK